MEVKQIRKSEFYIEMMVEYEDEGKKFWVILCMLVQMQKRDKNSGKY